MAKLKENDVNEELEDKEDSVIQEQIKPWHKRKFKKTLSVIGLSILAGVIFGIAARFVFKYSDGLISRIFGLNVPYDELNKTPVTINTQTTSSEKKEDENGIKINQDSKEKEEEKNNPDDFLGLSSTEIYKKAIDEMHDTSLKVRKGIVNISAVSNRVNWMGEQIEQKDSVLGIIITESPNDLFILSYYDMVKGADRIEITLGSGNTYIATVAAHDEGYNLAVMLLPKQAIKQDDLLGISVLPIGDSDDIYLGMPIIGTGSMDGLNEMTEYGYVTSDTYTEYITDASVGIFTTNLGFNSDSEGVITDINGKVVGIVTRRLGSSVNVSVYKCLKINSLIKVAERLCNGKNRLYCGINAEDIPSWALKENDIESGIYVTGIEMSSPASDAGIRKGDFILAVAGKEVRSVEEYSEILSKVTENSPIQVTVYRSSKSTDKKFEVNLIPVIRN